MNIERVGRLNRLESERRLDPLDPPDDSDQAHQFKHVDCRDDGLPRQARDGGPRLVTGRHPASPAGPEPC